jgi:hypothetical protein
VDGSGVELYNAAFNVYEGYVYVPLVTRYFWL